MRTGVYRLFRPSLNNNSEIFDTMNYVIIILFSVALTLSDAQLFLSHRPSTAYSLQPEQHLQPRNSYAHPSVIENSLRESQLPAELQKSSRFYSNPQIAAALAKESWFTNKEMPVIDREAEKIPREMVYKIFKNAGFIVIPAFQVSASERRTTTR